AEPLDQDARAGTREHMLGDRQLDAAQYPKVVLQCQHVTAGPDGLTVQLAVTLRDHTSHLSVPVKWQREGSILRASGEVTFTQTALGLEPYSLLFGALRVGDEIRARFRLVARTP
ncbi:MAG TPA: YceI family protein, partial [Steroidobacteraceae bacterium]|nr:YceI family protein [Steroidobacteraceae bacterium]